MENQQEQMSLFEAQFDKPKLPRHIRLIEIFAGIGDKNGQRDNPIR